MFSGIGGFEVGIANSRYGNDLINVGYSEIDKYADSIYKRRFPVGMEKGTRTHTPYGDATKIDTSDLPNFDLLVGGFPCQAFSLAGKRGGFDDTRGTLFFEIIRFLEAKEPRYFLLENVKGLLSHNKGNTFKTMLGAFSDLGYDVEWEILNSKNHGVPQNRERIYLKGYSRRKCGREILHKRKSCEDTTGEISGEYFGVRTGRIHQTDKLINCLGSTGQNSGGRQLIRENSNKTQKVNKSRTHSQKVYSPDGVSVAICSGSGGDGAVTGLYTISDDSANVQENKNGIIKVNTCKKQGQMVYDVNGVSCALMGNGGGDGGKTGLYTVDDVPIKVGNVHPSGKGMSGDVYDEQGICSALTTNKGQGMHIKVDEDDEPKIHKVGNFSPSNHYGMNIYGDKGLCPTLCSGNIIKNGLHILDEDQDDEWFLNKCKSSLGKDQIDDTVPYSEYTVKCDRVYCDCHHGREVLGQNGVSTALTRTDFKHTLRVADDENVTKEQMNHNVRVRRLTPVECERLQAFPDNWTLYGVNGEIISNTQRYKCIGNAVTTNVVRDIFNNWDLKID